MERTKEKFVSENMEYAPTLACMPRVVVPTHLTSLPSPPDHHEIVGHFLPRRLPLLTLFLHQF